MLTQEQLNAQYREILGRDAPASDLAAWNNVGGSINDYRNALIATPEFSDRYGEARRSMSPDDPRLNPAGFNAAAARQGPAFTEAVGGQPITPGQMQPPMAQPGGMTGRGYQDPNVNPFQSAVWGPPDWTPRNTGGMGGGPPDWLGGILGQLMGGGGGGPGFGAMPRNNQFTDLFGASPGQFGSGAVTGQQTSAMSNPISASPFGRNYSTRRSMPQMGIPTRGLV
jgi:hypothetical protein